MWDKLSKVMHYDVEYISSGYEENDWIIFKSDKQKLADGKVFDNPYFAQQMKIMHGGLAFIRFDREMWIYEGDILQYEDEDGELIHERVYFDNVIGLYLNGITEEVPLYDGLADADKLCIAGNIFENPELLKEV